MTQRAQWYIASFMVHRDLGGGSEALCATRQYWCLLTAESSNRAHTGVMDLARATASALETSDTTRSGWILDGIMELLMLSEAPSHGSELIWEQAEFLPEEILRCVKEKADLSAFRSHVQVPDSSEWYVCELVLVEVHDTGSHGDSALVWINTYLLRAADAESAYRSAISLGGEQATEPESHRCDDDTAHWEFRGLRELVQALAPPEDGAILWYEQSERSLDEVRTIVPRQRELGVFEWEERQSRSGESPVSDRS